MSNLTALTDPQRVIAELLADGMSAESSVNALYRHIATATNGHLASDSDPSHVIVIRHLAKALWNDRAGKDVRVLCSRELGVPLLEMQVLAPAARFAQIELSAHRIRQRTITTVWMAIDPPQDLIEQGVIALPDTQDLALIAERLYEVLVHLEPSAMQS